MKIRYRPSIAPDIQAAGDILQRHQLDPGSGLCVACGSSSPCATANDAASLLVGRGCGWPPDLSLATVPGRLAAAGPPGVDGAAGDAAVPHRWLPATVRTRGLRHAC